MSAEQKRAALVSLVQQAEARFELIIGRETLEQDRADVLGWLPTR